MVRLQKHERFNIWFTSLRDHAAQKKILSRLRRLSLGNPGDVRPVGEGVSELRIHHGPGYRIYFTQRGPRLILLLGGGTKSSQPRDIRDALAIARDL